MGRRSIGIDIGPHSLRAVQITRDGEQLRVERVFRAPTRRSTDSPHGLILSLWHDQDFDARADVAVALPHRGLFYCDLQVTGEQRQRLTQGDASVLERHVPLPPERTVTQVCTDRPAETEGQRVVLLAAADRQIVQERLRLLAHTPGHQSLVDVELCAVRAALWFNYPESRLGTHLIAHLDETHFALGVVQDGALILIRNTPLLEADDTDPQDTLDRLARLLIDEARLTWQKVFGRDLDERTTVYLSGTDPVSEPLCRVLEQAAGCTARLLDPGARVAFAPQAQDRTDLALATGLAVRALIPRRIAGVNFLHSRQDAALSGPRLRRELTILGVLLATCIGLWVAGVGVQRLVLEHRYRRSKQALNQAFAEVLPEVPTAVHPVAQVEQALAEVRREHSQLRRLAGDNTGPLRVLAQLSHIRRALPDLLLTDILVTDGTLRLTGSCLSFDQVHQWQLALESVPGWRVGRVDPRREGTDGRVQVTLLVEFAKEP